MPNRLANETSPYLLQHSHNPVNWWPWCEEAFATAASENKPVLLSIGYAACHWCHVMERESFEDQATAEILNAHFIAIKLDREERPDIDQLYMEALHRLGEQGGWPLNMFLTPNRKPFWGGTYFPPEQRYGRPSFKHVLTELNRLWTTEPDKITGNATALAMALQQGNDSSTTAGLSFSPPALPEISATIVKACDHIHGGLKGAPKFPQAPLFQFLWGERHTNHDAATIVTLTLDHIARGGIYDHLAGGIARYSVDSRWLVPHFEKMLYDNAQFVTLASKVCCEADNAHLTLAVAQTVDFILSDFLLPDGTLGSSFDADSEGEEGRYYVWSKAEIHTLLNPEAAETFCTSHDITTEGNFEGHNIPNTLGKKHSPAIADATRARLLQARQKRVPPAFDDKTLLDWNALAITALATASFALDRSHWLAAAQTIYLSLKKCLRSNGQWFHAARNGKMKHHATAEGLANIIQATLTLHGHSGNPDYLDDAIKALAQLDRHHLHSTGSYHLSSDQNTDMLTRKITIQDDATPNANGTMAMNFAHLFLLTDQQQYHDRATCLIQNFSSFVTDHPFAAPTLSRATRLLHDQLMVTIGGDASDFLVETVRSKALDGVIATKPDQTPSVIICQGQTCSLPLRSKRDAEEYVLSRAGIQTRPTENNSS
jgi:uncharacterized protein